MFPRPPRRDGCCRTFSARNSSWNKSTIRWDTHSSSSCLNHIGGSGIRENSERRGLIGTLTSSATRPRDAGRVPRRILDPADKSSAPEHIPILVVGNLHPKCSTELYAQRCEFLRRLFLRRLED